MTSLLIWILNINNIGASHNPLIVISTNSISTFHSIFNSIAIICIYKCIHMLYLEIYILTIDG